MDLNNDVLVTVLCCADIYTLITTARLICKHWNRIVDYSVILKRHILDEIRTKFPTFVIPDEPDVKRLYPYIIMWCKYRNTMIEDGIYETVNKLEMTMSEYILYQADNPVFFDPVMCYEDLNFALLRSAIFMCSTIPNYNVLIIVKGDNLQDAWTLAARYIPITAVVSGAMIILLNGSVVRIIADKPVYDWTTAIVSEMPVLRNDPTWSDTVTRLEQTKATITETILMKANRIFMPMILEIKTSLMENILRSYEHKIVGVGSFRNKLYKSGADEPSDDLYISDRDEEKFWRQDLMGECWRLIREGSDRFFVCVTKGGAM